MVVIQTQLECAGYTSVASSWLFKEHVRSLMIDVRYLAGNKLLGIGLWSNSVL
jgi:hypothetical protein